MILVGDFVPRKTQPKILDFRDQLVLANLEGPVCSEGLTAALKAGPSLFSTPFNVNGRWAFALANNHLMDYGEEGFRQTESFLDNHGYLHTGAGMNVREARHPVIFQEAGKRIVVFSCCEKQFGIAGYACCGVAEKGLWLFDAVAHAKKDGADHVIVSCHAAAELSPFPSPALQDFYRHLIDAGVDIVHGHHSHVPQGWEEYHGGLITYGLGNFVVDPDAGWRTNPNYLWSLIVHVDFSGTRLRWRIEKAGSPHARTKEYIDLANAVVGRRDLIEGVWQEIAVRLLKSDYAPMMQLPPYFGRGEFVNAFVSARASAGRIRSMLLGRRVDRAPDMRLYWHYLACESHRDAIETALGVLSGAVEDRRTDETAHVVEQIGGVQEPVDAEMK